MLAIDFETRSHCDLTTEGTYKYAGHPSTEVLCMAWKMDDQPTQLETDIDTICVILEGHSGLFLAHNAQFERLIMRGVLDIDMPPERFYCTMAQAQANSLPAGLDAALVALGLKGKTVGAHRLVMDCCTLPYNEERLGELYEYCVRDVDIMAAMHQGMQPLTAPELEEYWASERVNDRGIPVDVKWATAAAEVSGRLKEEAKGRIQLATGCSMSGKLTQWIWDRVNTEGQELMASDNKSGVTRDEAARGGLLGMTLAPEVTEVVELLDMFGGASVSKYQQIVNRHQGGRVRGCLMFSGAGQTGRFSSRGLQVHNLPRACTEEPQRRPERITVANATEHLRPTIYSLEGLTWGDWAQIEAVVLPWLSGSRPVILDKFAAGADMYEATAEQMGVPRQVAKAMVLGCGFGGGANAYMRTARLYGVEVDPGEAAADVGAWRKRSLWWRDFRREVESAVGRAMRRHGEWFEAGRLRYQHVNPGDLLLCRLPSGRTLKYPRPRYDTEGNLTALKAYGGRGVRSKLWYGRFLENATQAVAADVLRDCLVRLEDTGVPVIFHCHDEIVVEGEGPGLKEEMEYPVTWGPDLPLRAEITHGKWYLK